MDKATDRTAAKGQEKEERTDGAMTIMGETGQDKNTFKHYLL